jgi:hypothetical protein
VPRHWWCRLDISPGRVLGLLAAITLAGWLWTEGAIARSFHWLTTDRPSPEVGLYAVLAIVGFAFLAVPILVVVQSARAEREPERRAARENQRNLPIQQHEKQLGNGRARLLNNVRDVMARLSPHRTTGMWLDLPIWSSILDNGVPILAT